MTTTALSALASLSITKEDLSHGPAGVLADLSSDFLALCERGALTYINAAGLSLLGVDSLGDLSSSKFLDLVKPEYLPIVEDGFDLVIEEGPVAMVLHGPDGGALRIELSAIPFGSNNEPAVSTAHVHTWLLHARDLSERVTAVNNLVANHKRFVQMVELSFDLVCLLDEDSIAFINPAGVGILGYEKADPLIGQPVGRLVHTDDQLLFQEDLSDLAKEPDLIPIKVQRPDGQILDVQIRVSPISGGASANSRPDARAFMVEGRDVTDRLAAAEGVRRREQKLAQILAHVQDGIITTDDHGRILTVNRAAEVMLGTGAAQIVGCGLAQWIPDCDSLLDQADQLDELALDGVVERIGRRVSGEQFPIDVSISPATEGLRVINVVVIRDVTERKRAELERVRYTERLEQRVEERTQDLNRSLNRMGLILNGAYEGIIGTDQDGTVMFSNPAAMKILDPVDGVLIGRQVDAVLHGAPQDPTKPPVLLGIAESIQPASREILMLRGSGESFPAELTTAPLIDADGPNGHVVMVRDITVRRDAQAHLQIAYAVFDTVKEGIVVCDDDWSIETVNPAFSQITGLSAESVTGHDLVEALVTGATWDTCEAVPALKAMMDAVRQQGYWEGEMWIRRPDVSDIALRISATGIDDPGGAQTGTGRRGLPERKVAVILNDITRRKHDEARIHRQANFDDLTGLPNRALFKDRLMKSVSISVRSKRLLGLMFIDLDGFKSVNDTMGHDAGDELLRQVATRLSDCRRETDTVARLGGDEFIMILPDLNTPEEAGMLATRVIEALEDPFDLDGQPGHISASIGIALAPLQADNADALLTQADFAMYDAKQNGKGRWCRRIVGTDEKEFGGPTASTGGAEIA